MFPQHKILYSGEVMVYEEDKSEKKEWIPRSAVLVETMIVFYESGVSHIDHGEIGKVNLKNMRVRTVRALTCDVNTPSGYDWAIYL